jgi:glycosyltransferase involved in cell wall biosynthesis
MESQGFSYIKKLAAEGIEFCLLTFETRQSIAHSRDYISKMDLALKWRHLPYHRKFRFLATSLDIACGMITAAFVIRRNRIGIVHARGFIPALIVFLPAKILNVKFLFDTRGLLADKYVGGGLLKTGSVTYKLMKSAEKPLLRHCDFFTLETYKHLEHIKDTHADIIGKMEVIPSCVDLDKFNFRASPGTAQQVFNLIYSGKIGTWYLIDQMLEFFCVLSAELPFSRFTFLTQVDPACLRTALKNKGIDSSRITLIRPERQDIPRLLADASAGIFFINSYRRYNSSPIKYAEYLACGLPVIVNKGIGDTDTITSKENIGVVVDEFSASAYKRACAQMIELLKEKDALRARCRAAAEKYFSAQEGAQRYLEIYRTLLEQ